MNSPIVGIRIPADLLEQITREAARENRTISGWIKAAIIEALKKDWTNDTQKRHTRDADSRRHISAGRAHHT